MSGKTVRPHMGVKVGERFVGTVKWLMKEHGICRDDAINLMIHQANNVEQFSSLWVSDINKNYKLMKNLNHSYKSLRKENRKLYMVIMVLSVACVTLAVL